MDSITTKTLYVINRTANTDGGTRETRAVGPCGPTVYGTRDAAEAAAMRLALDERKDWLSEEGHDYSRCRIELSRDNRKVVHVVFVKWENDPNEYDTVDYRAEECNFIG